MQAVADSVSHADMSLRFRLRLLFNIISASLTVCEILSETGDWFVKPDIHRLRLRMCLAEIHERLRVTQ